MNRSNPVVPGLAGRLAAPVAIAVLAVALFLPAVRYLAAQVGATVATVQCLISSGNSRKCD